MQIIDEEPLEAELRYVIPNRAAMRLRWWGAGMIAAGLLVLLTVVPMLLFGIVPVPHPMIVAPAMMTLLTGLLFGGAYFVLFGWIIARGVGKVRLDETALWLSEQNRWIRIPRTDIRGLALELRRRPKRVIDFRSPPPDGHLSQSPAALLVRVKQGWIRSLTDFQIAQLRWVSGRIAGDDHVDRVDPPLNRPHPVMELGQMTRFGWWGITGFFTLCAVLLGLVYLSDVKPAIASASWPTVTAEVLESSWESSGSGSDRTYAVTFRYRYSIDDRVHESDRYAFAHAAEDLAVRQLIDAHSAGEQVVARVDPADPSRATILTGVGPVVSFLLFGMPVLILPSVVAMPFLYPRSDRAELQRLYLNRGPDVTTHAPGSPGPILRRVEMP